MWEVHISKHTYTSNLHIFYNNKKYIKKNRFLFCLLFHLYLHKRSFFFLEPSFYTFHLLFVCSLYGAFSVFLGCCFVTFFTRKAALLAQDALHNVKTLVGVSIHFHINIYLVSARIWNCNKHRQTKRVYSAAVDAELCLLCIALRIYIFYMCHG